VVIFADNGHDDAGWVGDKPYFDVSVDCSLCHDTNLITVHGNNCATCHPAPRNTLATWNGGCQQGGCHTTFHQESTTAHLPFESPLAPQNNCNLCHDQSWAVPQSNCLNCHATNATGDTTPPITTANALAAYNGQARIDFSITDNGKVGIGTTFSKLDGGPVTAGSYVFTNTGGIHNLEFWSVDQAGNIESPTNTASFEVVVDTTPPTTTSNAQASYNQGGGVITLTATDASTRGVKTTYYRLNGGAIQTGTSVVIPATSGTVAYTLTFWSEDWSGNIEPQKSVNFTVTIINGEGTIRLVWGYSDVSGSPCAGDPDADASWSIGLVGSNKVLKSGSASCPNWSGVNDVVVSVNTKAYWVVIDWWDSEIEDYNQTRYTNVPITTSGQIDIRRY
jgi:hypothetical protein